MFRNYFKTTFRFLLKSKTFTFINIVGLTIGTLCCLYIVLYVVDQYSYDKYYKDADRIYRVIPTLTLTGNTENLATISPPVAPAMKNDFGEVEQYARIVNTVGTKEHLLRYKETSFYENNMIYADSTFFDILDFHFIKGDGNSALAAPYSVVLMKPVADKLFGHTDPMGKLVQIEDTYGSHDYKVTGVIDESLGRSSIEANLFISMNSGGIGEMVRNDDTWSGNNFTFSFVKLAPNANAAALEKKLPAFLSKHGQDQLDELGMKKTLHLQPITSLHTTTGLKAELGKTISPSFLKLLLLIAVLIQLIACINFMNLSTARSSRRAKEVGVRKVLGAGKGELIRQFLGESFVLTFIAVLLALPLLFLLLPFFNRITGASITLSAFGDFRLWISPAGLIIITGLLSGSYPAFYLSAFRAVKVIKGNFTSHLSATGLRRSMVVFQFVISITLISAIIVIFTQMNYIKNKNLGFDKNQKLVFTFYTQDALSRSGVFVNDLKQLPGIKEVSRANNYPGEFVFNDASMHAAGGNAYTAQDIHYVLADENYRAALGIKMEYGRDFRKNDIGKAIVNETTIKKLGLDPEKALGAFLYSSHGTDSSRFKVQIAGIMKDYNYNSLRDVIDPFMLVYNNDQADMQHIIASADSKNYESLMNKIEVLWNKDLTGTPFTCSFLDDTIQKQYKSETTMSRIINSFTLIAIFISCLGLLGLTAFSAEQRTKEIGIRKTLGASVFNIMELLSKDFIKLVIIALMLAVPFSWWIMNKWLQHFSYRISIQWWIFAAAGLLAVCIAILTVSLQAVKAARANPVKSLREE